MSHRTWSRQPPLRSVSLWWWPSGRSAARRSGQTGTGPSRARSWPLATLRPSEHLAAPDRDRLQESLLAPARPSQPLRRFLHAGGAFDSSSIRNGRRRCLCTPAPTRPLPPTRARGPACSTVATRASTASQASERHANRRLSLLLNSGAEPRPRACATCPRSLRSSPLGRRSRSRGEPSRSRRLVPRAWASPMSTTSWRRRGAGGATAATWHRLPSLAMSSDARADRCRTPSSPPLRARPSLSQCPSGPRHHRRARALRGFLELQAATPHEPLPQDVRLGGGRDAPPASEDGQASARTERTRLATPDLGTILVEPWELHSWRSSSLSWRLCGVRRLAGPSAAEYHRDGHWRQRGFGKRRPYPAVVRLTIAGAGCAPRLRGPSPSISQDRWSWVWEVAGAVRRVSPR